MSKHGLILTLVLCFTGAAHAAGGGALLHYETDISNKASVQRGAANFMNYCSGCHSLKYLRYGRMAEDNGITEGLLKENLMFTADKPGQPIVSAMPAEAAKNWFGQVPPDLSLTARARGADWIYSFLKTFYLDPSKPTGVNNKQLAGASMPHVLGQLEGYKVPVESHGEEDHGGHGGHGAPSGPKFEIVQAGLLSPAEYDRFVGDITNFLSYAAEPGKETMHSRGKWALLYIFLLIPLTYLIKREFWKDVH